MKKYLMIIVVFLICGCSPKYSLEINGKEINENIQFTIDKNLIVEESLGPELDFYSKDSIDAILKGDVYSIIDSTKKTYKKDIKEKNEYYDVNLSYEYKDEELNDSRMINECFENKEIDITDDKISIHLYGKFYCLNEDVNNVEFRINTPNKIESSSIEYNFLTNNFVWNINNENANNVDIELTVLTEKKSSYYGVRFVVIGALIVAFSFLAYFIHKLSKRKEINEI